MKDHRSTTPSLVPKPSLTRGLATRLTVGACAVSTIVEVEPGHPKDDAELRGARQRRAQHVVEDARGGGGSLGCAPRPSSVLGPRVCSLPFGPDFRSDLPSCGMRVADISTTADMSAMGINGDGCP